MQDMTPKVFIAELSKTRGGWILDPFFNANEPNASIKNLIRKKDPKTCPITAVCKQVTGKTYRTDLWRDAAKLLGLNMVFAWKVVDATDEVAGYDNDNVEYDKKLRQEILEATGLKEEMKWE